MHRQAQPGSAALPSGGRPWTPLALTLGLHLLLVLAWMGGAGRDALRAPPQRASLPVWVRALPMPETAAPAPAPALQVPARAVRPPPRPSAPPAVALPAPAADDATPATEAALASAPRPAPSAPPAATAESPGLSGDLLATSKRMAGAADRALHDVANAGATPITAEPDRKWERFAEAVGGARIAARGAVTLDSYTAGDGVVIYRKTVGGRVRCHASGSVGGTVIGIPGSTGRADSRSAGSVSCPTGVSWTRH